MPANVDIISTPGISFEFQLRPIKTLNQFANARLTVFIDSEPIWYSNRPSGLGGVDWTWSDLLSFLTSNWAWILNEQGLPIKLEYVPEQLAGTPAQLYRRIEKCNNIILTDLQKRAIRNFCLRHDLASGISGIELPPIFILRLGNKILFSSEKRQILVDIDATVDFLSRVGGYIYSAMLPFADNKTIPLLKAWENRDVNVHEIVNTREYLLARMSKSDFEKLSTYVDNNWHNKWHNSVMYESAIFAAARMSSEFVPINQQIDILDIIRSEPAHNIFEINNLSECVKNVDLWNARKKYTTPFQQGYLFAEQFRECYKNAYDLPINIENIITSLGINIYNREWPTSPLDALSCWSAQHGPLIILNTAVGKRCSHSYGKNFTLAHELCHLLIDRGKTLTLIDVLGGGMPPFIEKRANAFAAELLLPREIAAQEYIRNGERENEKFIKNLRDKYNVSRKTVASQIFNSQLYPNMDNETQAYYTSIVFDDYGFDSLL